MSLQSRIVEIDQRKRLAPVVLGKYITEGSKTTDKRCTLTHLIWVTWKENCCSSEVWIVLLFQRDTWAYIYNNEPSWLEINLVVCIGTSELIPTERLASWSVPASYHNKNVRDFETLVHRPPTQISPQHSISHINNQISFVSACGYRLTLAWCKCLVKAGKSRFQPVLERVEPQQLHEESIPCDLNMFD